MKAQIASRNEKKLEKASKSLDAAVFLKGMDRIAAFLEDEPGRILGRHLLKENDRCVVNAYLPRAQTAWVRFGKSLSQKKAMKKIHPSGFYQALFDDLKDLESYKIGSQDADGYQTEVHDPYAFPTNITDEDVYLYGEGNHFRSYERLGAHLCTVNGVAGVHFAVWAPNAKSVSLIGNFNHWMPGSHPMMRVHFSGIWALFIPGLNEDEIYKFAIKTPEGNVLEKSDPYGFFAELRPHTASIVTSLEKHQWRDDAWMASRDQGNFLEEPMSVYEVHLGSWRRDEKTDWGFMNYRDLAHQLVDYVKEMGFTHIQLMPITEHPLDMSWGYQVINYYAPTSRFGKPEDFMYFVDHCHQNGIGVILDWVPSHFPKDMHGLNCFDGRQIYAYENWKKGEHREWGTLVFDYGRHEVKNFLISNALFWLDKYHLDGLRVDAVASMLYLDYSRKHDEWEPNMFGGNEHLEAIDFLKKFNEVVHLYHPGVVTIAEESTAWGGVSRPTYLGGLGFSMKWNMGWMHDSLVYFSKDAAYRKWHQGMLTFSLLYAFTENFVLPISHDEVVHGKGSLLGRMPGDEWQQLANLKLFMAYMFTHPGKKLLFMGSEFAQVCEWNHDQSLEWHVLNFDRHRHCQQLVKDLNHLYRSHRALYERDFDSDGFEWIDFSDADQCVISYVRLSRKKDQMMMVVSNMTPVPRHNYRIGVPQEGFYKEVLNTDAKEYGGSGIGNLGGVHSEQVTCHGRPYSVNVQLPPLAVCVFLLEPKRKRQ